MNPPGLKITILETPVLREVLAYLSQAHIYHMRMNTTGIPRVINGKMILTPNPAEKGKADVIAIIPLDKGCRVLWLDTKREKGGVQSPVQKIFEHKVKKAGCEYHLVRSVDQLKGILDAF